MCGATPSESVVNGLEALRQYATTRGGSVDTFHFDCGDTVTISIPGRPPRRFSAECGDQLSAAELALAAIETEAEEA